MKTTRIDISKYLDNDEVITAYLNGILAENNAQVLLAALGHIAKARSMTQVAEKAGLSRESLYRALSENGNPRFDTLLRILDALNIQLKFTLQGSHEVSEAVEKTEVVETAELVIG